MTQGICCGNNTDAWLQGEGFRMTNSFENARGHFVAHAVTQTALHCSARSTTFATKERGYLFWDFLDDCALCCSSDAAACLEPSSLTGSVLS